MAIATLAGRGTPPALHELGALERDSAARIAELNRAVQARLDTPPRWGDRAVGEIDVLCAAIIEQEELRSQLCAGIEQRVGPLGRRAARRRSA
jgi:hypothetical protein